MSGRAWSTVLWRLAVLALLAWIGLGVQRLHHDLVDPVEPATTVAEDSQADELPDQVEALRDDVADLATKVDAILVALARLR